MTMCRILVVKSDKEFEISRHLERFAALCRRSKEYQGHGWGLAVPDGGRWKVYKSLAPVWEQKMRGFGRSRLLMVHARSAFRNENISLEYNMPFDSGRLAFAFNGELRGVRIGGRGVSGAEKIFHFVKRLGDTGLPRPLKSGGDIIAERTAYVRAMNMVSCDMSKIAVYSRFSEDEEYFSMRIKRENGTFLLCSEKYPDDEESCWERVPNHSYLEA